MEAEFLGIIGDWSVVVERILLELRMNLPEWLTGKRCWQRNGRGLVEAEADRETRVPSFRCSQDEEESGL